MEISVLGHVQIVGAGTADGVLSSPTQRRALLALVANRNDVVPTERLAEMVGVSSAALRTAISRLRHRLGASVVSTSDVGYRLGPVEVDLDCLQDLVDRAHASDVTVRPRLLGQAIALWRGEAYADCAEQPWAMPEANRLGELRSALIEEHADLLIDERGYDEAVERLEEHIARHPFRDRPRGLLMRALAAEGRQTEALRVFQTYRRFLGEHAGTQPGDQLVALDALIARGWTDAAVDHRVTSSSSPSDRGLSNLRQFASEFVGRHAELDAVARMVRDHRIVTVTGVGGAGKTRLTLQASADFIDDFVDGVWFVDLAPVRDPDGVIDAIAVAVGVSSPGGSSIDSLTTSLRSRHVLLLLDNCEHLLSDVSRVVDQLIARTSARVLATSREALGVDGERLFQLDGLGVATSSDDSLPEAVAMFVNRAQARDPDFGANEQSLGEILGLCRQLDGLPLALELAASRLPALSVTQIIELLDRRLDALASHRDQFAGRHQTLRRTIGWSVDLLDDAERNAFTALSAFRAGFDLEGAEALIGDGDVPAHELVGALVDKSLLVADPEDVPFRYRYLETVRHLGEELLRDHPHVQATMRSLCRYLVAWARRCADGLMSPQQLDWIRERDAQFPNLQRAVNWAIDSGDEQIVIDLLSPFGDTGFHGFDRVGAMARGALAAFEPTSHPRASRVISLAAAYEVFAHGPVRAAALSEQAVAAWNPVDNPRPVELVVHHSTIGLLHDRLPEAADVAARAAAISEELKDAPTLVPSLAGLSLWNLALGRPDSEVLARRAYDVAIEHGNPTAVGAGSFAYGVHLRAARPREALDIARAAAVATRPMADAMYETVEVEVGANLLELGRTDEYLEHAQRLLRTLRTETCRLEILLGLCPSLVASSRRELAASIVRRAPTAARIETLYQSMWRAALDALETSQTDRSDVQPVHVSTDDMVDAAVEWLAESQPVQQPTTTPTTPRPRR